MSFERMLYDPCNAQSRLKQSVGPMEYRMYSGANVNFNSCNNASIASKQPTVPLIDINSELRGLNRFSAHSVNNRFSRDGHLRHSIESGMGMSTFDPRANVYFNPMVCPDVSKHLIFNSGIPRAQNPGYHLPSRSLLTCADHRTRR